MSHKIMWRVNVDSTMYTMMVNPHNSIKAIIRQIAMKSKRKVKYLYYQTDILDNPVAVEPGEIVVGSTIPLNNIDEIRFKTPGKRVTLTQGSIIPEKTVDQIQNCLDLPKMDRCMVLPNISVRDGYPSGIISVTHDGVLYPHLLGSSIGDGMRLTRLDVDSKLSGKRMKKLLDVLRHAVNNPLTYVTEDNEIIRPTSDDTKSPELLEAEWEIHNNPYTRDANKWLGVIGKEVCALEYLRVVRTVNKDLASEWAIDKDSLYISIRSGSHDLGRTIAEYYSREVLVDEHEISRFMKHHNRSLSWGALNRGVIIDRYANLTPGVSNYLTITEYANTSIELRSDDQPGFVHLRDATSTRSPILLSGSPYEYRYLVQFVGHDSDKQWGISSTVGNRSKPGRFFEPKSNPVLIGVSEKEARRINYLPVTKLVDALISLKMIRIIAVFESLVRIEQRN